MQRQALAGMLWTKQVYLFDVHEWLDGDNPSHPPPASRRNIRNMTLAASELDARALDAGQVGIPVVRRVGSGVPVRHARAGRSGSSPRNNLWLLLFEQFQHPNGQIPGYEWEFSDVNPPVHAWACWRVYSMEKQRSGDAPTAHFSSAASTSCSSISRGGSTRWIATV